jgi:hypothetical protein
MLLAASRLAGQADPTQTITNRRYMEMAEEIENDPAFRRAAERYVTDPAFRNRVNDSIMNDPTPVTLEMELQGVRFNRNPVRQARAQRQAVNPQPARQPVNQAPERQVYNRRRPNFYDPRNIHNRNYRRAFDRVDINELPEGDLQNPVLADATVNSVRRFAHDSHERTTNKELAKQYIAATLTLTQVPVYAQTVNGEKQRVMDSNVYTQTYTAMMNDPVVDAMAERFASDPEYRAKILEQDGQINEDHMIAQINADFDTQQLEAQRNNPDFNFDPQHQLLNPNAAPEGLHPMNEHQGPEQNANEQNNNNREAQNHQRGPAVLI